MKKQNSVVVHQNKEDFDVLISRPSKWGNPFTHHKDKATLAKYVVETRLEAVQKYREYITSGDGKFLQDDLKELLGKRLGCWCGYYELKDRMNLHCHGQILLELLNKKYPSETDWW